MTLPDSPEADPAPPAAATAASGAPASAASINRAAPAPVPNASSSLGAVSPLHDPLSRRRSSASGSFEEPHETPMPSRGEPGQGGLGGGGSITFVSPFASYPKRGSISPATITIAAGRRPSIPGGPGEPGRKRSSAGRSSSHGRSISSTDSPLLPPSRRSSLQDTPSPMRSPSTGGEPASPFFTNLSAEAGLLKPTADSYRRRSVDVGVLGVGNHRLYGATAPSRRVRNAIGPDAGDKETGVIGAGKKGGRDRMLGRYLASLLAHSLALCAAHAEEEAGEKTSQDVPPLLTGMSRPLDTIPASPLASPLDGRGSSILSEPSSVPPGFREGSASPPPSQDDFISRRPSMQFPSVSRADRIKLVGFLQSWSFDALSLTPNELLVCMGLIFESLGSMEGVDFDLDRFRALLLSLRAAYHERNGYHNFKHAADVTQACYSFLTRMGLVPPLYLLCEENFDPTRPLRKWRRNRAVEQSSVGQLLRPHDVFALMVACMGHDVGHPGLTNAYMVNARAPVAQVYDDKSILENFHTVTLIHMLRKHHFDDLLGGDFGCLGASATPFRRVLESSILATDMSRHFAFVTDLNELRKRTEAGLPRSEEQLEADRLLLCAGLIKCADISNPTRPHRISRMWAAALQAEWAVQANIEAGFGLPVTVITQDPADAKAQAKGQVGFIDLFCKPLFAAMAGVVEEFADFLDKLETGRAAWESIASQTDQAFSRPLAMDFALPVKPPFRRVNTVDSASQMSEGSSETAETRSTAESAGASVESTGRASPTSTAGAESKARPIPGAVESRKARPVPLRTHAPRPAHGRHVSNTSVTSISISPRSPSFFDSASSATTTFSSLSQPGALTADSVTFLRHGSADPLSSAVLSTSAERAQRSICGGACMLGTAMCEVCAAAQRRGSLGNVIEAVVRQFEGDDDEEDEEELHLLDDAEELNLWPPHPFQPTKLAIAAV